MSNPLQEDVLSIMAHVVVADNVIRLEQIDAFIKGGQRLGLKGSNGERRSRKWLLNWFDAKLPKIKGEARNRNVHEVWRRKLVRLRSLHGKEHVLNQMCQISNANGKAHTNEQILVAMAAGHWGLTSPDWLDATG